MDFTVKYSLRLSFVKAKAVKSLEDKLIQAVVELTHWSLENKASECSQGHVFSARL